MDALIIDEDRSSKITIGGKEYDMLLTVKATKDISKKFGGLGELGKKFEEADVYDQLDDVVWLITLLCNQCIMRKNFSSSKKQELLKIEDVEVMMTPKEISNATPAIFEAMSKGSGVVIKSETDSKNKEAE